MTLLYFAQVRRITALASESLRGEVPLTSDELWQYVLQRHPDLASLRPAIRLARNGEFASAETIFQPGDEIALIPPVSGG
ncbi:MoaD/ThiS family protein [bacterium]|jgi:molybdopterin converting factor subunit 1|nr:MoaD/ThiS family protein [bacterium]